MNLSNEIATLPLSRAWNDRFALDIAQAMEGTGDPIDKVLVAHGHTEDELIRWSADPLFAQQVERYRNDLRTNGYSFKLKAKAQSELLLDTSWKVIHDVDVSPAVKADLIKWTAKMAGYEPTKDTTADGGGVKINIVLGDVPAPKVIEVE